MRGPIVLSLVVLVALTGCNRIGPEDNTDLNMSYVADVKGFDPAQASDMYSNNAIGIVYEGLMQYAYLKRPYEVEPCLADGMPEISEDGRTYTFRIKQDVLFHDDPCFPGGRGRELTAADFVYSFKRVVDQKNRPVGAWIFEGKVLGLDEWAAATTGTEPSDYDRPVAGLRAPDDHTLVIELTEPYPQLLFVLAMGYTKAVPREAVEQYGQEFLNHPVGTGPFRLTRWMRNLKLVFDRNPTYHPDYYPTEGEPGDAEAGLLEDAGKRLPFADRLVVSIMVESQPRWLYFLQGRIDTVSIPKDNFDTAIDARQGIQSTLTSKGIRLFKEPSLDVTFLGFNMDDPVVGGMENRFLRQAMSAAYNIDVHIQQLRSGVWAIPARGPIPPGIAGYNPDHDCEFSRFDLERARSLMAEAGFPGGEGLPELAYENSGSSPTSRQFAEFFKDQMAQLGIRIKISGNTWPEFDEKVKEKRAQLFGMAWGADYPDAQNFLQLFYGPYESPGPNSVNYKNPEYDRLYEQMAVTVDSPERREIIRRMVELLCRDMPMSYNDHRLIYGLYHSWIKNYKYLDIDRSMYKYYRIDRELKRKTILEKL